MVVTEFVCNKFSLICAALICADFIELLAILFSVIALSDIFAVVTALASILTAVIAFSAILMVVTLPFINLYFIKDYLEQVIY